MNSDKTLQKTAYHYIQKDASKTNHIKRGQKGGRSMKAAMLVVRLEDDSFYQETLKRKRQCTVSASSNHSMYGEKGT